MRRLRNRRSPARPVWSDLAIRFRSNPKDHNWLWAPFPSMGYDQHSPVYLRRFGFERRLSGLSGSRKLRIEKKGEGEKTDNMGYRKLTGGDAIQGQDCVLCCCNRAGAAGVTLAIPYESCSSAVMARPLRREFAGAIYHLPAAATHGKKCSLMMPTGSYF
jgi:hypothetical protein